MPETVGLAKSAQSVSPVTVVHSKDAQLSSTNGEVAFLGIPVDYYGHFGIDLNRATEKQREKMAYMSKWLSEKHETLGDRLLELRKLEGRIGMTGTDSRIDKVYRYMRLSDNIKDLEKQRQALEARGGNW